MSYASRKSRALRFALVLIAATAGTVGCTTPRGPMMGAPGISIQGQLPGHLSIQVDPRLFQSQPWGGVPYAYQGQPQYYTDPSQQYVNPGQQYYTNPAQQYVGPQYQQYAWNPSTTGATPAVTAGTPLATAGATTPTGAIPATGAVPSPLQPTGQVIAGSPGSSVNPVATAPQAPGTTTAQAQGMQLDRNWIQYFHDNVARVSNNDLRLQVQQGLVDPYAGQALTPDQRYQATTQRYNALESLRQAIFARASENTAAAVAGLKQAAQPFSRDPQLQGQAVAYLTTIDSMADAQIRADLERMYNEVVAARDRAAQERDASYQAALAQQAQAQQLYAQQGQTWQNPQVTAQGAPRIDDPLMDVDLIGVAGE